MVSRRVEKEGEQRMKNFKVIIKTDRENCPQKRKHDHTCYCGTGNSVPHKIGKSNCIRFMTEAPDLRKATLFAYIQQRGFHRHPCGCWSRYPGSDNSIE